MDDIICTVPWCCGESDCPQQWHVTHYWMYSDGTYSSCDSDGNHESCEASDVPEYPELSAAWRDYSQYVLDEGVDPLGEFVVRHHRIEKQRYTAWFQRGIVGWVMCRLRRGRTNLSVRDVDVDVCDYLHLVYTGNQFYRTSIATKEFGECEGVTMLRGYERCRATFTLEKTVARKPEAIAKDLRKAARRRLRRHKEVRDE